MDLFTNQPLASEDAERIRAHYDRVAAEEREHMDRAERETREWLEARLHHALHGSWLEPDECATCLYEAEKAGES